MTLHFSDIKENALGEQLMLGMGSSQEYSN